jgi:triosephosphate isomerase
MGRQFFVGGNFKMYVTTRAVSTCKHAGKLTILRNGTVKAITDIVENLNKAKLDESVGMFNFLSLFAPNDPNLRSHHQKANTHNPTEVVISPPALYLLLTREHLRKGLEVAAQNIFDKPNGAFTGEISADQLKDSGITWAILGHSERRQILQENDDFIASKTKTAVESGLGVILCCGESLEQREAGDTVKVVTKQLKAVADKVKDWSKIVVAYEPIW